MWTFFVHVLRHEEVIKVSHQENNGLEKRFFVIDELRKKEGIKTTEYYILCVLLLFLPNFSFNRINDDYMASME